MYEDKVLASPTKVNQPRVPAGISPLGSAGAERESHVNEQMSEIRRYIDEVEMQAANLINALNPLLRESCPEATTGEHPVPCLVPLANELRNYAHRLRGAALALTDARGRLEL